MPQATKVLDGDVSLEEEQIAFVEIKGQCATRTHNIQDFKDGKIRVIFLNSTNNGAGINLQEANTSYNSFI